MASRLEKWRGIVVAYNKLQAELVGDDVAPHELIADLCSAIEEARPVGWVHGLDEVCTPGRFGYPEECTPKVDTREAAARADEDDESGYSIGWSG